MPPYLVYLHGIDRRMMDEKITGWLYRASLREELMKEAGFKNWASKIFKRSKATVDKAQGVASKPGVKVRIRKLIADQIKDILKAPVTIAAAGGGAAAGLGAGILMGKRESKKTEPDPIPSGSELTQLLELAKKIDAEQNRSI
jgi:hypothetical protein